MSAHRLAVETTDAFVVVTADDGTILLFNPAVERLTGVAASDAVGRHFWELLPAEERDPLRAWFFSMTADDYPESHESTWRTADGRLRLTEWRIRPMRREGRLLWVSTGIDVSERRRAEEAVGAIETIGNLLAHEGPSHAVLDRTLQILADRFGYRWLSIYLNEGGRMRLGAQIGYDDPVEWFDGTRGIVGRVFRTHERAFVRDVSLDPDYLVAHPSIRSEISLPLLQSGELFGILNVESASPLLDEHDLALVQSVADRVAGALALHRKLQLLEVQAFHDALTGLANRALFADRVEHALARHGRDGTRVGVVFLDLDDFKTVNDGLGHAVGDELLCRVAERLTGSIRAGDTVARLGGDEFAVLLESVRDEAEALAAGTRLLAALDAPVSVAGRQLVVSASVGVIVGGPGAAELLRDADVAMYRAKAAGKGRCVLFEPQMRDAAIARLDLERELRASIAAGDLFLEYQPIVDARSMRIDAVEALVRWRHPTRGVLLPGTFVEVAEETGLITALGRLVLREAARQARAWQEGGVTSLRVCVNISPRQLGDLGIVDDVRAALDECGLPGRWLTLEITESVLMQHPERTIETLTALRALGVRIAIDDFGTGYSSLSYVKDFPLDVLKIDRSFVGAIGEGEAIVETMFRLGRVLGLETVAEGVETPAQLTAVRGLGADLAQGFLIGRPLPPGQLAPWLTGDARPVAAVGV